jgi:hypothetical protein
MNRPAPAFKPIAAIGITDGVALWNVRTAGPLAFGRVAWVVRLSNGLTAPVRRSCV